MGQYYLIVNIDKHQYLHPHKFGDGLKLLEFGCSFGTMCGLAILLADGNNRGNGDLRSDNPIIGSWAGDRIVVAGDYADPLNYVSAGNWELQEIADKVFTEGYRKAENVNLFHYAHEKFEDVSDKVIEAMMDDGALKEALESNPIFKMNSGRV